jgi:xylulokinase
VSHILTFDLGTTYFKICLFDDTGRLVAVRRTAPPIVRSKDGRCELPVDGFRHVLTEAVLDLGRSMTGGLSNVVAISFATQANSFVLLDEHDQPLNPIIMWPDNRACPAEPLIDELSQMDGYYQTTGIPQISGQFMPAKLLWLKKHEPEVWSRAQRMCLISDYLTLWMTGQHATEAGTAGLTGLVDLHELRWWLEACQHLSISDSWLPKIVRAGTDLGEIRQEITEPLGLPPDCRFVVGCLDQYAGAIGAGNVKPGGVSETTGTVLATVRCADCFNPDAPAAVFQGPGPDDHTWYQMVFGDISANLLESYRNSFSDRPTYEALCDLAREVPRGCDGLRVGGSDPLGLDPVFVGLTEQHTSGHRVRAILEAVSFALNDQLNTLCGGDCPPHIRSVGGAARSDLWLQIKADVLGLRVQAIDSAEPTSLGAAILAAYALGWGDLASLSGRWVRLRSRV